MTMTPVVNYGRDVSLAVRARRGATVVECAVALPVMFLVLFAMLDLGIAAARYNALAEAARRIAREVIIHGALAPPETGTWGPDEYTGTAADGSEMVDSAKKVLLAMPAHRVNVRVAWPDGDNSPRDRVEVEVSYRHEPLIPALFVWGPFDLRSVATMHIVN